MNIGAILKFLLNYAHTKESPVAPLFCRFRFNFVLLCSNVFLNFFLLVVILASLVVSLFLSNKAKLRPWLLPNRPTADQRSCLFSLDISSFLFLFVFLLRLMTGLSKVAPLVEHQQNWDLEGKIALLIYILSWGGVTCLFSHLLRVLKPKDLWSRL